MTEKKYICTQCGGDATIGYSASKKATWFGKVKPGERICLVCGYKRGITFFSNMKAKK